MVAIDQSGDVAVGTSTNGLSLKIPGWDGNPLQSFQCLKNNFMTPLWLNGHWHLALDLTSMVVDSFIYLGFYVTFNTVQVISGRVVLWAEETSTYSWSRFCTVNCRASVSNYQLSHIRFGVWTADFRDGRRVCYHYAPVAPVVGSNLTDYNVSDLPKASSDMTLHIISQLWPLLYKKYEICNWSLKTKHQGGNLSEILPFIK